MWILEGIIYPRCICRYTLLLSMVDQVTNGTSIFGVSLGISSLKLALTYNEALLSGRLTNSRPGAVQPISLGPLRKQVEGLLKFSDGLKNDLCIYLNSARWPNDETDGEKNSILISWYLQWYGVPAPSVMWTAIDKNQTQIIVIIFGSSIAIAVSNYSPQTPLAR